MRRTLFVLVTCTFLYSNAYAANPSFQEFFFDVCTGAMGALAARCSDTDDALGNLSGDSESSLNPSQYLDSGDAALSLARDRARSARDRAGRLEDTDTENGSHSQRWSLLLGARYASDEVDREVDNDPDRSHDRDTYGFEIGTDYRISSRALAGALLSFEQADLDFVAEGTGRNFEPARTAGEVETDSIGITVFGVFNPTATSYVDAAAGVVLGEVMVSRNSVFQESNRIVPQSNVVAHAKADQTSWWASVNAGIQSNRGPWNLAANVGFNIAHFDTDTFEENDRNGTGLEMIVTHDDRRSLIGILGVQAQRVISTSNGVVAPQVNVTYHHEFETDAPEADAQFVLDPNRTVYAMEGTRVDRNYLSVGIGLSWILPNGWMPYVNADTLVGYRDRDRYRLSAGLRKEI